MSPDIDPVLSGKPGDPRPLPPREAFGPSSLGHYLDSPAGQALVHAHRGDRHAAANAMAEHSQADERWRRERAQEMYDRDPSRYPGGAGEALARIGCPAGGGGAHLAGRSQDIAAMTRRTPGGGWVVGPEPRDDTVKVGQWVDRDGNVIDDPSLTMAPWQRAED